MNFLGPVRVCRAVLPHLRAQHTGLAIHVTSIVGRILFPGCGFYCATKFAHEAYAEVLHYELTGADVESVILEPGPYPSRLLPNSPSARMCSVSRATARWPVSGIVSSNISRSSFLLLGRQTQGK
jgi:NADP-dependent 3-hydroxy acid dehydrogenase YdfG